MKASRWRGERRRKPYSVVRLALLFLWIFGSRREAALQVHASRLFGKASPSFSLSSLASPPLPRVGRNSPGCLCCLRSPIESAKRLFRKFANFESFQSPSESPSDRLSSQPADASRPAEAPPSFVSEEQAETGAVGEERAAELESVGSWFEAQGKLWAERSALFVKRKLNDERRDVGRGPLHNAESDEASDKKKIKKDRRLVFASPSLLDRGWLVALSGSQQNEEDSTTSRKNGGGCVSLNCLLFVTTPNGRVAVAPARFLSKASESGRVSVDRRKGGALHGRPVKIHVSSSAANAVPWVSLEGLLKLRRSSKERSEGLWFGGEVPDFESFYENAPFSVLLIRELLDRPLAVPTILAAATVGAAIASRQELQRHFTSLLLSRHVWSSYSLWSPLMRAPPALALLFLRLFLHCAGRTASAATAATRRVLEDVEARLLEKSVKCNVEFFLDSNASPDASSSEE